MSTYQDYANAVSNILEKKGEAQARATEQGGQLWGSTIANLGQVIPQQVQQAIAQHAAQKKTAQIQSIIQQNGGDLDKSLPLIMGVDATIGAKLADEHAKVQESIAKVQKIQDDAKEAQRKYAGELWAGVNDEASYAHAALVDKAMGGTPLDHYDPEWVTQKKQSLLSLKDQLDANRPMVVGPNLVSPQGKVIYEGTPKPAPEPKMERVETVDEAGNKVTKFVTPSEGQSFPAAAPAVAGGHVWVLRGKDVIRVPESEVLPTDRRPPAEQQISPTAAMEQGNAKEVAKGLKDGTTSPEVLLSSRTTQQGMALLSELHKLGVDTDKMTREWLGTKAAIRSLDSASQVRLAQVINKASASLDRVEQLNKEWSGNATRWGVKVLNHASLKAAQNGAYGPEAASVAQRLEGQIADVTGELGQGIMGGNAPTDHALILASKNLSTDWTQKVLDDSIQQARYNLKLAQSARNEMLNQLGVQSTQFNVPPPGASNPQPAAAPKVNPFR